MAQAQAWSSSMVLRPQESGGLWGSRAGEAEGGMQNEGGASPSQWDWRQKYRAGSLRKSERSLGLAGVS